MSNREVIQNKISFIEKEIAEVRANHRNSTLEEIGRDKILRGSLERSLYVIVQAVIDLAEAVVSYKKLRKPTTMREAFDILVEGRVVPREFVENFHKMVGFRNILARGYEAVKVENLYDIFRHKLTEVEEFISRPKEALNL